MIFPLLQDVNLEPLWEEEINHKLALKHDLLFSTIDGVNTTIVEQSTLGNSLNHLSKLSLEYPIVLLDIESFERLKNKFLEIQTGSDFEDMSTTSEELIEAEADLLDFIRNSQDLLSSEESAPIIKLVNSLFFQALKKGASDIHIESGERKGEVRLRIDGALKKHLDLERSITGLVINRIKVISNLDISEKRLPHRSAFRGKHLM
jgi:general secretion pathway protein E